ncbi:MAG: type II toxin-antitoxin system MqsR family toxin [Selenomonadaceae bacterium]|nr:type II toxin-antitoxin system MqsR family toxin [Selenomonadaceae bacterium]
MPRVIDKFIPTYNLEEFKSSDFRLTVTATDNALDLGFDIVGVHRVVSTMQPEHFYKSMTSYTNHRVWQDVYHVPYGDMTLYIKFTEDVISEFLLLSFKEK